MTPVKLIRYRGYLIRIVNNGLKGYEYEWTVGHTLDNRKPFCSWWRANRGVIGGCLYTGRRLIDPTSIGDIKYCIGYAKDEIDSMLAKPDNKPYLCKPKGGYVFYWRRPTVIFRRTNS